MKRYLSFLVLVCLALGTTPAYSQSPWVDPSNGFTVSGGGFFNTVIRSPQPNIVAGSCYSSTGQGSSNTQAFISDDNGQTWQQQTVASTVRGTGLGSVIGTYAVDIFMLDGQHAWLLSQTAGTSSLLLSRTTTGLAGLVALPNPLPAAFTKIHFFTPSVGLALASTPLRIFRTIDGGNTWNVLANVTATGALVDFPFITSQDVPNTVWMFTDNAVLRTTDAGLTWTTAPIPARFRNVAFENSLQGLSVGAQSLFRTTDGGLTWTPIATSSRPVVTSITALPGQPSTYMGVSSIFVAPPQYIGTTSITRDGGNTWQTLATDAINFAQLVASSPSHIWVGTARSNPTTFVSPLLHYTGTTLATKNTAGLTSSLRAYPNPSTGIVQLAGPLAGKETARVYDAAGRLCQQEVVSDAHRTLDLSAQAPGLYLLKLTAPDGTVRTQRLSKLP